MYNQPMLSQAAGTCSHVPLREEIAAENKWNLSQIFSTKEAFQQAMQDAKLKLHDIALLKGTLASSADALAKCLQKSDKIHEQLGKIYAYARMHRDTNAKDPAYQAMTAQAEELLAKSSSAMAFIEPELMAIPENTLREYLAKTAALSDYEFYIQDLLRLKQHVLSPAEEELLAKMSEIRKAPSTIFEMLTNADMEFPETPTESGAMTKLSEGRYNALIRSENRDVRKAAFENLFSTYAKFRNTLATTFSGNVKSSRFYSEAKKFDSTLSAALESDNIPGRVYSNVIDTIRENLAPLHAYVSLKKELLSLDEIHMYDLYVPLTKSVTEDFPYEKGLQLVLDSLRPLGQTYLDDLSAGCNNSWTDLYENQGKRTGAYSWGVYGVHPFVLLNYNNKYGAVSTLAHELGHAMHSYYSNKTQPYNTASYTIFCAEVASTTNEILLLDHMLDNETDQNKRAFYINQYLEQVRTTVYRQTMFADFERLVHEKAQQGEALTADVLESIWLTLNRDYYGSNIVIDEPIKNEWSRIPHFYRPFYVYKYVTGYAAATTLAMQLRTQGKVARKQYLDYLKSGGSNYSIDLLKTAGVDMTSSKPLQITLDKFNSRLKELEILLKKS